MSFYPPRPTFATILRSFAHAKGVSFGQTLTEQDIQPACDDEGVQFGQHADDVYTPAVTLDAWRRKGRRVLLADGCELSMPDTPANQKEYSQLGNQKPGLGRLGKGDHVVSWSKGPGTVPSASGL